MKKMTKRQNIEKLMRLATLSSVVVAGIIVIIKLIAWIFTGSLSLLSSLVDSGLDMAASLVSFFAVRYSLRPADEDHRFGHGKAEYIASFTQSVFIFGSGIFIIVESVKRFISPYQVGNQTEGVFVMGISCILTVFLITFQSYVIKQTNSSAIKADSIHYRTDLLINMVVILALVADKLFTITWIDPLFAIFIALYIIHSAYKIVRQSFDGLMDKEFSEDDRATIIEAILSNPEVRGVHDLRTRISGLKTFIQFHLELDGNMKLGQAHMVSDEIESSIKKIFPDAEIIIHKDSEDVEEIAFEKGRVMPIIRQDKNNQDKK